MQNMVQGKTGTLTSRINAFLKEKDPELQKIAKALRAMMKQLVPDVKETVNPWGVPTFEWNGPLAIFIVASKHVTFGFHRGTSLPDPEKLLEGTGKSIRHVKMKSVADLQQKGLRELVLAVVELNRETPNLNMREK